MNLQNQVWLDGSLHHHVWLVTNQKPHVLLDGGLNLHQVWLDGGLYHQIWIAWDLNRIWLLGAHLTPLFREGVISIKSC